MPKPNRENIITDILIELAKGTTFNNCFKVILSKFKLSEPTFATYWKDANSRYVTTQIKAQQAISDDSISQNVEAAKSGLKSKFEWVAELQKELDENRVEESVLDLKTGKVIRFFRTMTPTERKGHMERISKFMGMDAPTKIADTDENGKSKESPLEMLIKKGGSVTIGTKK